MTSHESKISGKASYEPTHHLAKDCIRALLTSLRFLKGVGPKRAAQLEGLGLKTVEDLIYHLPFRYEDRRRIKKIQQASLGEVESYIGKVTALEKKYIPRRRRQMLLGRLTDDTGSIGLVWYHTTPYIWKALFKGMDLLIHGRVEKGTGGQKQIVHPEFETIGPGEGEDRERILPIYLRPGGIPLGTIRRLVTQALSDFASYLPRSLPETILRRQRLMDLREAMSQIHYPDKTADLTFLNQFASTAHRAIIFDEFFYLQLGLRMRRKQRSTLSGISFVPGKERLTGRMQALLPFTLTKSQERILEEIYQDMGSSEPMQRLIQGDVGSGKTIVAWFATLRAIENGFQAVWMAPTELLAEQHFHTLKSFADKLGLSSALLTGSLPARVKKETTQRLEKGEISFVVGTQALIQEGVHLPRMGLGIIDEQHRFGVLQRMALQRRANSGASSTPSISQPDILLMSATPIPRSLAMVLYGDMEVSSLDEMPPGRTPVQTRLLGEQERPGLYELIRAELKKGHQAYIVYPLVEASERLQLRDATRMAEELSLGILKDFSLALIHGRMSADEQDQVMRRFKEGKLQILVATTVIEVGIDIPNATIMVVEHAERFGLSQLHQLRGRVGRGEDPSLCILVQYESRSSGGLTHPEGFTRLKVMEKEHNGFKIAEADLTLRGPGELLGTRQSGLADFRLANLVRDSQLLLDARREAIDWLRQDPFLTDSESLTLKEILKHRWGRRLELGSIG